MRKFLFLLVCLLFTTHIFSALPAVQPAADTTNVNLNTAANQQQVLIYALTHHLTVKQYKKLSGKRLTLKEKIGYFLLKHKLVKADGKDKTGAAIGGFLLGLLFGPIGVGIAFIASKDKTLRNWSLLGLIGWVVLVVILLAAAASLFNYN